MIRRFTRYMMSKSEVTNRTVLSTHNLSLPVNLISNIVVALHVPAANALVFCQPAICRTLCIWHRRVCRKILTACSMYSTFCMILDSVSSSRDIRRTLRFGRVHHRIGHDAPCLLSTHARCRIVRRVSRPVRYLRRVRSQ